MSSSARTNPQTFLQICVQIMPRDIASVCPESGQVNRANIARINTSFFICYGGF